MEEPKPAGKMPRWTPEAVAELVRLYPDMPNDQIAMALGRSVKSVNSKGHRMRLKKSAERLTQMGKSNQSPIRVRK